MASVNKKFAVEKGLEVGDDALVVDADGRKTGIGKTDPKYGLDVALTANFDGIVAAESVGIGSTQPGKDFDINKDTIIRKKLFDSNVSEGTNGQVLISTGTGVSFTSQADITTNAAGGTKTVQFKGADGKFGGADNFVYDSGNNRVGIGSTIPEYLLQTEGGQVHFDSQLLDSNKTVGAAGSVLGADASGKSVWEPKGSEISNVIFVTENGNDENNGLSPGTAKRTVGGATSIAVAGNVIRVAGGIYTENNPVLIPRNVTIDGDDLRNTQIVPTNVGKDLFHVTNGTLIQNLSFVGAANTGAIIAFPPEGVVNRHTFSSGYGATNAVKVGPNWHTGSSVTPTDVSYDPLTGITTFTKSSHGLTVSDTVGIVTNSIAFSCDQDSHASIHSYPRASDPVAGIFTAITAADTDTFTINVSDAGTGARIAGIITQGPYVRNCTNFVPDSIGMKIDGNAVMGLKAMNVDSYTQYNQGGIGVTISNDGYAQLVSIFTICDESAITCVSGGQCDVNNSNASFGTYGLIASGVGTVTQTGALAQAAVAEDNQVVVSGLTVERPYTGQVLYLGELFNGVSKVTVGNPGSGYTSSNPPTVTIGSPTGPNGITAEGVAVVSGFGSITAVNMFATGSQYRSAPTVTIAAPSSGITATATASLEPSYFTINSTTPVTAGVSTITLDQNLPSNVGVGSTVPFARQSLILASSYTFEYIGAGLTIGQALPRKGGTTIPENETTSEEGGKVVYTSTDERGNLKVGDQFTINQQTGTVTGDAFNKSIQATLTPLIIALGQ
tara:strand:- start:11233 stop:13581 length:2349 start_codon:yes stop_codon:yes gene_type:complete